MDGISAPILFLVGEGNPWETKGAALYPTMKETVHVGIIPFAAHWFIRNNRKYIRKYWNGFWKKYGSDMSICTFSILEKAFYIRPLSF